MRKHRNHPFWISGYPVSSPTRVLNIEGDSKTEIVVEGDAKPFVVKHYYKDGRVYLNFAREVAYIYNAKTPHVDHILLRILQNPPSALLVRVHRFGGKVQQICIDWLDQLAATVYLSDNLHETLLRLLEYAFKDDNKEKQP